MIWCASVVLPQPGGPPIRLKEYSGRPPPRISSRPGTPVGKRSMVTVMVMAGSVYASASKRLPHEPKQPVGQRSADQAVHQPVERLQELATRTGGVGALLPSQQRRQNRQIGTV